MIRIGISLTSSHSVTEPWEGAQRMVERAMAAERVALDSLFVGDHHAQARPYYQNSVILARMLAHWTQRPVGALYLLPLWHPVIVAEQIGTLASLTRGRFILQCALGGDRAQSRAMGSSMKTRVPVFETSLNLIRRLLAGETVDEDRYFGLEGARIAPRPVHPVDVWIGSSAPAAIDRAARLGDAWLAAPSLTVEEIKQQFDLYSECCASAGRTPHATIRRDIFIGGSVGEAAKFKANALSKGYRRFAADALICGDVAEVAAHFALLAEIGYQDVIVRNISSNQHEALAVIERLAEVRELLS